MAPDGSGEPYLLDCPTAAQHYYCLLFNLQSGSQDLVPLVNSLATIQILFIIAIPFFSRYLTKTRIWITGLLVAMLGGASCGWLPTASL